MPPVTSMAEHICHHCARKVTVATSSLLYLTVWSDSRKKTESSLTAKGRRRRQHTLYFPSATFWTGNWWGHVHRDSCCWMLSWICSEAVIGRCIKCWRETENNKLLLFTSLIINKALSLFWIFRSTGKEMIRYSINRLINLNLKHGINIFLPSANFYKFNWGIQNSEPG